LAAGVTPQEFQKKARRPVVKNIVKEDLAVKTLFLFKADKDKKDGQKTAGRNKLDGDDSPFQHTAVTTSVEETA